MVRPAKWVRQIDVVFDSSAPKNQLKETQKKNKEKEPADREDKPEIKQCPTESLRIDKL